MHMTHPHDISGYLMDSVSKYRVKHFKDILMPSGKKRSYVIEPAAKSCRVAQLRAAGFSSTYELLLPPCIKGLMTLQSIS